jgi:hypothetical protein
MQNVGGARVREEFFTYSTGRLAALATGASSTTNIQIQADSDFVIEKMTYDADLAGVARTVNSEIIPNVLVLLTITGSGLTLTSVPVPLNTLFGNGKLPFILPYPRLLPASSVLQVLLTSYEAASAPSLTLNFVGRKRYALQG